MTACAVTPDGQRVVSASDDRTLRVWDLDSGRVLATFKGHTRGVTACAVTPDGRRLISASKDLTLRVWDLDTYGCLLTHRGDASFTAVASPPTTVVAGDIAGTIWFLDWPPSMAPPIRLVPPPLSAVPPGTPTATTANVHPPKPITSRQVIFFVAANPSGTSRLAFDEECAAIERELRMTTGRDDFDFHSKWAVSVDEMMRHMNELPPTIIHFSGHGGGTTGIYIQDEQPRPPLVHRGIAAITAPGIQLQDDQRQPQHVSARALTQMISSAAPSARVVVLNACYTDAVAEALRGVVDCVVGMRGAIGDDAARSFAVGFYRALGYRRSVGNAVAQAVATLAAKQLPDEHLPVCRTREGISADQVVLDPLRPSGAS